MRRGQEVELGDIIFSLKMLPTHQMTAPSTTKLQSLKLSFQQPRKSRLEQYTNARKRVEEQNIFEVMGHTQPPTPIQTDNSTADGIINSRVQPKCTKAMDMRFHWLTIEASTKNNSDFIGAQGRCSKGITGQNITPLPFTAKYEVRFYHHTKW